MRRISRYISTSRLFAGARSLLQRNMLDWNYPLSKWHKVWVGCYMILRDHGDGVFPPKRANEQTIFDAEKAYHETLVTLGKTPEQLDTSAMRKPFWYGPGCAKYLRDYILIQSSLSSCGIRPPARLLEVGCGSGWLAEFLVSAGFDVLATTLDPSSREKIERRHNSLVAKGLPADLEFRTAAMEYIQQEVSDLRPFDAIYVYEALHHAHDWKKAVAAFHECLCPGGWCFIFNEPNVMHTFVSYRVGRLSNTHEIGINQRALRRQLRRAGFGRIRVLRNRMHWWTRPLWIAAQKDVSSAEQPSGDIPCQDG